METKATGRNVAVYLRASSNSQDTESQKHAMVQYIENHGISVPLQHWYVDQGFSGKNMDRPALIELEKRVFTGEIGTVLFYSLDRFARNMIEGLTALDKWQRAGVKMVFVSQSLEIDPTNWMGKIMLQIMASMMLAFAQMERERILARRKAGVDAVMDKVERLRELQKEHPDWGVHKLAARAGFKKLHHVQYLIDHPQAKVPWGGCRAGERGRLDLTYPVIVGMLKKGYTAREIAKIHGCTRRLIYKRIAENTSGGIKEVLEELAKLEPVLG